MHSPPIPRITRVIQGVGSALEVHARECGDRVLGVALHPEDQNELSIVEVWGLPVLGSEEVPKAMFRLICEARELLIPPVETCEDLLDRWSYHLERDGAIT